MAGPTQFNWQNSTKAQRRKLYEAYRSVFKDARSIRQAIEAALGKKVVGDRYVENFARAISAVGDSADLFTYLSKSHPAVANELMRTLDARSITPWEAYYRKYRKDDRLAVALDVDHASPLFRDPPGIKRLYRDDTFYLQLDSEIEGHAIGFWKTRDYWFRLLLGPTAVSVGRQWITRDEIRDDPISNAILGGPSGTGNIRAISYNGKDRFPEFVVIVADLSTLHQFLDRGGHDLPIRERTLDMFPNILETSKSPWAISWVKPSFVERGEWGGSRSE